MQALLGPLRAAAEATRLRILALCAHSDLSVSELTQILGQSQPRVSRHLKLLCDSGLLTRSREGVWAFFRTAEKPSGGTGAELAVLLVDLLRADDPQVVRDQERLEQVKRERVAAAEEYFRANAAAWSKIRSLYVDESEVESRLLSMAPAVVDQHVDLGTGTGRMLEVFRGRAKRGLGVDASREMLAIARANLETQNGQLSVRQADIYNVPLPNGSADLVTLHQVLHFLVDPAGAIREAARILRPGGKLLVVDFLPHELEFLRKEHAHRRLGFADHELQKWYEDAGLIPGKPEFLRGDPLTVAIWPASAPAKEERR